MRHEQEEKLIYLIRHGKIAMENNERRYIGHIDIPLSAEGVKQARLLQAEFARRDIAAVFCSDLTRSVTTARIIAENTEKKTVIRKELREISMGEWEGKAVGEIKQFFPEEYANRGSNIGNYRIPGAESFAECQDRIVAAFSEIVGNTEGNLLIVGHAGINRLLLCHILGMPIENLFRISQDYGCINMLVSHNGQYCVRLVNKLVW